MLSLIPFVVLTASAAVFGSLFQPGEWYEGLVKPSWTPPNWVFGPVWTILYLMIAAAGWQVWRKNGLSLVIVVWTLQIILNASWSWAMFGEHEIGLALLIITVLVVTIIIFAILAWPISRTASLLFFPYLAWVLYASSLNAALWNLNG